MTRSRTLRDAPVGKSRTRTESPAAHEGSGSAFDVQAFLESAGLDRTVTEYQDGVAIYRQGDRADHIYYVRSGSVKLSVVSKSGREAVVAMLGPGDFFGEACLVGREARVGSATATARSQVVVVAKLQMQRLLHSEHAMSDRFIAHMLIRNGRIEEDLIDQLFNSSEKRLARTLLLLAHYGSQDVVPAKVVPRLSQETLAEMVGTTRSRVNLFLNKFEKLGFIDYDGRHPISVNNSLLTVVLRD